MNQYPPSLEKMDALADFECAGLPLPDDLQKFKQEAWERWKNGVSIAEAFGISDNIPERIIRRDFKLREYADLLYGTNADKSEIIKSEIDSIRQRKRNVSQMLLEINKIYRLPGSARHIRRILDDK